MAYLVVDWRIVGTGWDQDTTRGGTGANAVSGAQT
jgi:hypothetical protein